MTEQPTTAAGRQLLANIERHGQARVGVTAESIRRIEAEARQQDDSALRREIELVCDAYGDKGWAKSAMVRRLRAALELPDPDYRPDLARTTADRSRAEEAWSLAALPPSAPPALDVERLAAQNEAWLHLFSLIVEAAGDLTLVLENNGATITTLTFGEGSPLDAATGLPLEPGSFAVNGNEPSDRLTRALARAVELVGPKNVKVGRFRAEYARLQEPER